MILEPKVLHLMLSGTSWARLQPLLSHGLCPTLSKLCARGSGGTLLAPAPQVPVQMEHSILSGVSAPVHGLSHPLTSGEAVRGATDADAATPSLVDHFIAADLPSIFVGWPHLQPRAQPECVVMPRLLSQRSDWDSLYQAPMAGLRVAPERIGVSALRPFFVDAQDASIWNDPSRPLLQAALAEAGTLQALMTWQLQHTPWRFASLRIEFVDRISQAFGDCHPPLSEHADPQRVLRYQYMVTGAHRFVDLLLARLIDVAGEHCNICLHSEQGPARPQRALDADAAVHIRHRSDHEQRGFILLAGPRTASGARLFPAELVDIAPTMLALLNLDPPEYMSGRVLAEGLKIDPAERLSATAAAVNANVNEAFANALAKEREELGEVEALGSIDVQELADEAALLSALGLLQAGDAALALTQLVPLSERRPQWRRCVLHRARCHLTLGDLDLAEHWIEQFLQLGAADLRSHLLLGQICLGRQQHDRALVHFFQAEQLQPEDPVSHCQIGDAYRQSSRLDQAKDAFERALQFDPQCAHGWLGLGKLALLEGHDEVAIEHCLKALEHQFRLPEAHFHLAVALARSGQTRPAIEAFELCLSLAPGLVEAHQWLARLYRLTDDGSLRAAEHEIAAQQGRPSTGSA